MIGPLLLDITAPIFEVSVQTAQIGTTQLGIQLIFQHTQPK